MLTYLPGYYATSRIMSSIADAQGSELDDLQRALDETLAQFFVATATWGLDVWEKEFGIETDETKPVDQRRSNLISKIRGTGTVTIELLKSIGESYTNGKIEVTQQPALYRFTVKFVDNVGLPPNIDDLKAAIEEVKPAHLDVQFAYRYLTVSEVNQMTINQLQSHPLTDFAPFLDGEGGV
ncbi:MULTISPECIES: YmfQ family protein [Cohnella]|uniref:YmfQ family protein n=1 Tax=Cohnella TaxID=329857 RepID=UPI00159406B5|nr:YmfQ family protein [Cohnella algarum]